MADTARFKINQKLLDASMGRLALQTPLESLPADIPDYVVANRLGNGKIVFYPAIRDHRHPYSGIAFICTETTFKEHFAAWDTENNNGQTWKIYCTGSMVEREREMHGGLLSQQRLSDVICMLHARDINVHQAGVLFRKAMNPADVDAMDFVMDLMQDAARSQTLREQLLGMRASGTDPIVNDF